MPGWKRIDKLLKEYHSLNTLSQVETEVLIESGLPAKGKPLDHNNMVKDHYDALVFACIESEKKRPITTGFIQEISSHVMKSTGGPVNQMGGTYDSSRGELRKGFVMAGNTIFPDYKKIPDMLNKLCSIIEELHQKAKTNTEILSLSFTAHYNLVGIHPFADGNGRVSRILMNYIQTSHNLPMGLVHKDEKTNYIEALNKSRDTESTKPIVDFMAKEYAGFIEEQINQSQKQSKGFTFMF